MTEELEASRERQDDLRTQIKRLQTQLEASQESIGLDQDHFRSAISCALELMGAEPLKSAEWQRIRPAAMSIPGPRPASWRRSNLGRHDGCPPRAA